MPSFIAGPGYMGIVCVVDNNPTCMHGWLTCYCRVKGAINALSGIVVIACPLPPHGKYL